MKETRNQEVESSRSTRPTGPGGPRRLPSRSRALAVALGGFAGLGLGAWCYLANAPALDIVAIQLGGRGQPWPLPEGTQAAVNWDYLLIAGYAVSLALGTTAARWVFRSSRTARLGQLTAVIGVTADLLENLLLTAAIRGTGARGPVLDLVAVAATVKFAALAVAVPIALTGLVRVPFWPGGDGAKRRPRGPRQVAPDAR